MECFIQFIYSLVLRDKQSSEMQRGFNNLPLQLNKWNSLQNYLSSDSERVANNFFFLFFPRNLSYIFSFYLILTQTLYLFLLLRLELWQTFELVVRERVRTQATKRLIGMTKQL